MRLVNAFDVFDVEFGSVCSGIEAASVAWAPLGWQAAWVAEIEPFPCAVLAHHYPSVPNLGDMTTIARKVLTGEVAAPNIFCGGTPCQAFSVAGLRQSLSDERGNLSLKFVELADAIDHVRGRAGQPAAIIFWENVPGVLSTKDNAFGCFLAGLAGEDEPLQPPGKRWEDAGAVYGPQRAIAWRTLDAQYFGLAQRRRRVFVVASARDGFDPAQVLFEWDGVRRDSAPRREAGKNAAVCPTLRAGGNSTGGDRPPGTDVDTADSLIPVPGACLTRDSWEVMPTMTAGASTPAGHNARSGHCKDAHIVPATALAASEDGTGQGTPLVPVAFQPGNLSRGAGSAPSTEVFPTLKSDHGRGRSDQDPHVMVPLHCRKVAGAITSNYGKQLGSSDTALGPNVIAFDCKASGQNGFGIGEIASTQRAMGHASSHTNGGGHQATMVGSQVRRLTPRECERLQGFPDDYTLIPIRRVPAKGQEKALARIEAGDDRFAEIDGVAWVISADGPRYKALGNSWAVPCVTWIGWRIASHLQAIQRRSA